MNGNIDLSRIGNAWTHPVTGEVRYYINNAYEYLGLTKFYHKGNFKGYKNAQGEEVGGKSFRNFLSHIKVWVGEDGVVHVEKGDDYPDSALEIQNRVQAKVDALGQEEN